MEEFSIISITAKLLSIIVDGRSSLSVSCVYGIYIFQTNIVLTKNFSLVIYLLHDLNHFR